MLSRQRSKEICSTKGSGFTVNKMDPCATRDRDCHSGSLPGRSGFTPCCTWAQSSALREPSQEGREGWPLLLVSATPLWGHVMHWMTNLMCINRVSGDSFQASHEIPSSEGIRQAKITEFEGDCGSLKQPDFFGEHKETQRCVCVDVCMHTHVCIGACLCSKSVYVNTHTFGNLLPVL